MTYRAGRLIVREIGSCTKSVGEPAYKGAKVSTFEYMPIVKWGDEPEWMKTLTMKN